MKILWSDKKRILGMPISFTRYSLSEDRFFVDAGFFTRQSNEILLYRVRDLGVTQSLFQRLLGVGTIHVHSSDKSSPFFDIKNVKKPYEVKEIIHQNVEKMKLERRMRVGEILEDVDQDYMDDDNFE